MSQSKPDDAGEQVRKLSQLAKTVADEASADVLFVNADVSRRTLDKVREEMAAQPRRRPNLVVLIVTSGGDADAAFLIARLLNRLYTRVTTIVPGWCKSAGTLIVLGSHELVMFDEGELGPLDVQILRRDELFEMESGLTTQAAMESLATQAFSAFENFFLETKISGGPGLTTRTATSVAVQLTVGLMGPLYAQIDPLHIGAAGRAMRIAEQYGARLLKNSNLAKSDKTLQQLLSQYPSHSFAIDREEADTLFRNVRRPTAAEVALVDCLGDLARVTMPLNAPPFVGFLSNPDPYDTNDESAAPAAPVPDGIEQDDLHAATDDAAGRPAGDDPDDHRAAAVDSHDHAKEPAAGGSGGDAGASQDQVATAAGESQG